MKTGIIVLVTCIALYASIKDINTTTVAITNHTQHINVAIKLLGATNE